VRRGTFSEPILFHRSLASPGIGFDNWIRNLRA